MHFSDLIFVHKKMITLSSIIFCPLTTRYNISLNQSILFLQKGESLRLEKKKKDTFTLIIWCGLPHTNEIHYLSLLKNMHNYQKCPR